jgi:hypothetical protein
MVKYNNEFSSKKYRQMAGVRRMNGNLTAGFLDTESSVLTQPFLE